MKKGIIIIIVLGVVIVMLTAVLVLVPANKKPAPGTVTNTQPDSKLGIEVLSPKVNGEAASPLHITGIVHGNGWTGFEGQVGTVHLYDADGKELAVTFLKATTEWTKLPTNFETDLTFTAPAKGTVGSLIFYNENPSGEFARSKSFSMPVMFK